MLLPSYHTPNIGAMALALVSASPPQTLAGASDETRASVVPMYEKPRAKLEVRPSGYGPPEYSKLQRRGRCPAIVLVYGRQGVMCAGLGTRLRGFRSENYERDQPTKMTFHTFMSRPSSKIGIGICLP